MYLKMSSAEVVCCKWLPNITDQLSIEANSVDPEQTAPIGAVSDLGPHCLPKRLLYHFSRQEKQTTFVAIDTLSPVSLSFQLLVVTSFYLIWIHQGEKEIFVLGQAMVPRLALLLTMNVMMAIKWMGIQLLSVRIVGNGRQTAQNVKVS